MINVFSLSQAGSFNVDRYHFSCGTQSTIEEKCGKAKVIFDKQLRVEMEAVLCEANKILVDLINH